MLGAVVHADSGGADSERAQAAQRVTVAGGSGGEAQGEPGSGRPDRDRFSSRRLSAAPPLLGRGHSEEEATAGIPKITRGDRGLGKADQILERTGPCGLGRKCLEPEPGFIPP